MGAFNIDATTMFIFPVIFKLVCIGRQYRLDSILNRYIYDLQNEGLQDIYMQNLTACLQDWKVNHDVYQRVLAIFSNHIVICNNRACLCFYLKYHYQQAEEKSNLDQLARNDTKKDKDFKIILYDDIDIDKAEERKKDVVNYLNLYSVNLYSSKMKTVMASFYYNCVIGMKKYVFTLYCSYISYLMFEVNNGVGAQIATYNLWYSKPYRENHGLFSDMIVVNYQDLVTRKLHNEFINSGFWLSKTRLTTIFEYFKDIDNTKGNIDKITKHMIEYYEELSNYNMNYKVVMNVGNSAWNLRKKSEYTQDKLYKANPRSVRLLCTFINYEINVKHHWNGKMAKELQELYYSVRADEKNEDTFTEQLRNNRESNMYKQGNMVVFLNVINSEFFIAKATRNAAQYFEYQESEFIGKNIQELMPECIGRVHDSYQLGFVNQKEKSIMETAHITGFAITKSRLLKMVSLYAKLEYFYCDDAFLCGLLVPHPRNNKALLVLDADGIFVTQNIVCEDMIGKIDRNSNLSLYMAIPQLHKNLSDEDKDFEVFQYDYFLSDFSRYADDPEYKQLNKEEDIMSADKDVYNTKLMKMRMKVILKYRERFIESIKHVQKLTLKIETYRFKKGVTLKLVEIEKAKDINPWIIKLLTSAAKSSHHDFSEAMLINPVNIDELYQRMKDRKYWTKMQTFVNKKDGYCMSMSLLDNSVINPLDNEQQTAVRKKDSIRLLVEDKSVEKDKYIEKAKSIDEGCDISDHESDCNVANQMEKINSPEGNSYAEYSSEKEAYDRVKQLKDFAQEALNLTDIDQKINTEKKEKPSPAIKSTKDIEIFRPTSLESCQQHPKITTDFAPKFNQYVGAWDDINKEEEIQEKKDSGVQGINDFFFTGLTDAQKDEILKKAILERSNIQNMGSYDMNAPDFPFIKSKSIAEDRGQAIKNPEERDKSIIMKFSEEEEIDIQKSNNIYKTQHTISKYIDRDQLEKLDEKIEVSLTNGVDSIVDLEKKDQIDLSSSIVTTKKEFVSIQLRQNIANSELKRQIIMLNRINMIAIFLFQILVLSLRLAILFTNNALRNNYSNIMQVDKSLRPLGWFVKEIGKYNLETLGYLTTTTIKADSNLVYDNDRTATFYDTIMTEFSYYNNNFTMNFFTEIDTLDQRLYQETQAPTEDVNQIFLLGQNLFDYYNFQRAYVTASDTYQNIYFFDTETAYNNYVELTYTYNTKTAILNTEIKDFESYYKNNLLFQEIGVAGFTTSQCILMIYVLFIMGNLLKDMSTLFQKLDKKIIDKLYKKYYDMYELLDEIDEKIVDLYYESEEQENKSKNTELSGITLNKDSNKDESTNRKSGSRDSKKKRYKKRKTSNSNKSRFSIFINQSKFSMATFSCVIILLIFFANTPFAIDFLISNDLLNKLTKTTETGALINSLSGNLALYYGLFYNHLANIKAGTTLSDTTKNSITTQDAAMRDRSIFQDDYISDGVLKQAFENTLCDLYFEKTGMDKTNCVKVTKSKSSYSLFIGLSDIFSFYDQSITSAESAASNVDAIVSSVDFIYMDGLIYYSLVICDHFTNDILDQLDDLLMRNKLYGMIFILLFPSLIAVYYYVFRVNFNKKMDNRLLKIENSFLLLPDELLVGNLYIRNYFDIKY